jgi:uncharacterized protein YndB with AHSA1/START domain
VFEVLQTITFSEQDGKTQVTMRTSVPKATAATARYLAGMEQGWTETLDRLAREVES